MKKLLLFCCLFAAALCLHARAIQEEAGFTEEKSRESYAFGMIIGSEFLSSGLEIDYRSFTDGLIAVMEDQAAMFSRDEAIEMVETAFQAAAAKRNEENQLKELLFLSANGERANVITTESGLQYEALLDGNGEKPSINDRVRVLYEGKLIDGTVFDSREEPVEFPLNGVIPGWSEGLLLMNVGSKYCLYLPSALAYGEHGAGSIIPPYSTLIFTVELLEIIKPALEMPEDDTPPQAE